MLSSSLTHSITKAYHIMPHNQTQYYHTLLISIPLKATENDPSYPMHQLSYLAQPKQQKLHNNSPGKTTILPIRVLPMPIRVLPTPDQFHTRMGFGQEMGHTRMGLGSTRMGRIVIFLCCCCAVFGRSAE